MKSSGFGNDGFSQKGRWDWACKREGGIEIGLAGVKDNRC